MTIVRSMGGIFLYFCSLAAFADATEELAVLLDEAWEWRLAENPEFASTLGERQYNDQWSDLSLQAIDARHQQQRMFMRRLQARHPGLATVRKAFNSLESAADQLKLINHISHSQFEEALAA